MLASNPSADFGPGYYSDINLRFTEHVDTDLYQTLPTKYLNAKENGIKKMSVVLADEAERELLEKETALMQTNDITNSSSLAKYIYAERASEVEDANEDYMKYLKFYQTNIYLRGTAIDEGAGDAAENSTEFKQYITYD